MRLRSLLNCPNVVSDVNFAKMEDYESLSLGSSHLRPDCRRIVASIPGETTATISAIEEDSHLA